MFGLGKSLLVTLFWVTVVWLVARLLGMYFSLGWALFLTVAFTLLLNVPLMLKARPLYEVRQH